MMIETKSLLLARVSRAAVLAALTGLAACSSVPDAVNPVEWYRGVGGWFESEEDQAQRDQARTAKETAPPLPGTDRDYPNLSTVPERPRSVSSPEERNRISNSLAADRENARYAKPEPNRPAGAELGAPSAVPRTPVTVAPSGPSPETLEALPLDSAPLPQPTPTAPRSSIDSEASTQTASAASDIIPTADAGVSEPVELPIVEPAAFRTDEPSDAAQAPLASAIAMDAPPSPPPQPMPTPRPQQMAGGAPPAAAQQPGAPAAKTAHADPTVGGDLPRSFMVYFTGGSAHLDDPDRGVLQDVAKLHKAHGGTLRVVGHASSGTRETNALQHQIANLRISSQRAETVASELARLGVPRSAMTVAGMSDSQPIYQGEAGNRRVEIFFDP